MIEKTDERVDILENKIHDCSKELLEILLKDRTTKKNIIWATDNYEKLGDKYKSDCQITVAKITGKNGDVIKPRTRKDKDEQKERIKKKAEVFTPSWVCNAQNNLIDETWFGYENPFNEEGDKIWTRTEEKVRFWNAKKTWQDYVLDKRLEITCGEAPYLVSRYDTVTGKIINPEDRIGILDRKIKVVNENTDKNNYDQWLTWVKKAFQSTYGYEWQGDSLLIARENLLYTFRDYYVERFEKQPDIETQIEIAKIISWNIWQMDGLKCVVPKTCRPIRRQKYDLLNEEEELPCPGCTTNNIFEHNAIYCKIRDWEQVPKHEKSIFRFVDLMKKEYTKK